MLVVLSADHTEIVKQPDASTGILYRLLRNALASSSA